MTNKVTINSLSAVAPTGTTFIVTNADDFKTLTGKGHRAVYFEFPKGLTNWTKAQGVDLDTLRTYGTGCHFVMLCLFAITARLLLALYWWLWIHP